MFNIISEFAYLGFVFYTSLLFSLLLVTVSGRLAVVVGVLDLPESRKMHSRAVPRMGGLAMFLAMICTILLCVRLEQPVIAFLLGAGIVSFVGLMDDRFSISPRLKFAGQIFASLTFVLTSGLTLQSFGDLFGFGEIQTFFMAPVVTVFCMVGVMNALNLSDGLDGLAGGIGFMAALFLALLAYWHQAWYWANICLVLCGVLLGFLRYNHYPASLFMGDTGSLLIGYTLSTTCVALAHGTCGTTSIPPISLAIILALPIFDTIRVMSHRLLTGHNPFYPDKSHLHHRLLQMRINHASVVTIIYGLMLFWGFWSWFIRNRPEWQQFFSSIVIIICLYCGLTVLEKLQIDVGRFLRSARLTPPRRLVIRAKLVRRVLFVTPFILLACLVVAVLGVAPLSRPFGLLACSAALFVVMIYPWKAGKEKMLMGHGVLYAALFFMLLIVGIEGRELFWPLLFLYGTSLLAFCWVLIKVTTSRSDLLLYPSGFELLLIFSSWISPFALQPILDITLETGLLIVLTCVQALPWLCLLKLIVRRDPGKNIRVAFGVIFILLLLGVSPFV
jgi:UDP-GlcNAc:undecaprenyl-phosphate GlcNAc-1-phosphate transferase